MNILIIQPTGDKFGHYGVHTTKLAQELAKLGHKVTVFTNKLNPYDHISEKIKFNLIEYKKHLYAFESFERNKTSSPLQYWFAYFRNSFVITKSAFNLCKKDKFDGIYITDVEFLTSAILLKAYSGYLPKIIMQINASNFSFNEYPGNFVKKTYKVFQREVFRLAVDKEISAFSILGSSHIERLRFQLRLSKKFPIETIPDGSNLNSSFIGKNEARKRLGISFKGDIFIFLGLLRRDKGLETLAEAIDILKKKDKSFGLIIAGFPFDYKKEELFKIFDLQSPKNKIVHYKFDYIEEKELPYYYYAADCLLLPYNNEYKGSSGPLMKGACSYNLPIIVSNVSDMGLLTSKHSLGFVYEPEKSGLLASRMNDFLELSISNRKKIKLNAKKFGKINSWHAMAKKYEEIFKKLLKI